MKRISLGFLIVPVLLLSCAMENTVKIKMEIPSVSPVHLERFQKLVVTNFYLEKEIDGFDLNQELKNYFIFELKQQFQGNVATEDVAWEGDEPFNNKDFWRARSPEGKEVLFLTGKASYTEETRKAILQKEQRRDEAFLSPERELASRKVFTLIMDIYIIEGKSGNILYTRDFKEILSTENPRQTADFAFFDLIQRIKTKFFHSLFGELRIQERYLISK